MRAQSSDPEKAVLVHVDFSKADEQKEDIAEFQLLVRSSGVEMSLLITATLESPHAKYFVGTGKAHEIRDAVNAVHADVVIVDHRLTPAQERNLEMLCCTRVIDRTRLILDIFARRARTFEGKLQVELAQLKHMSTRLVRGWTHLERQKGGIGLRGPGETQLETDRRLLRARIGSIMVQLEKVRRGRATSRRARQRRALPSISLVGYTNAGKSTLFNRLTGATVYAANELFATLDPTLRKVNLQNGGDVILADTVGFIRHLPHDLVAAFRATLEETLEASLLIHVIDTTSPTRASQIEQVNAVLHEIGADQIPILEVYNKIDAIPGAQPRVEKDAIANPSRVWLSAQTGEGITELTQAITTLLFGEPIYRTVCLGAEQGKLRSLLYHNQFVLDESIDEQGQWILKICLPQADFEKLFGKLV